MMNLRPMPCLDCRADTSSMPEGGHEYYHVHDSVWQAARAPALPQTFLCVGCIEQRLGRVLIPQDFANMPLNDVRLFHGRTKRLTSRLVGVYT